MKRLSFIPWILAIGLVEVTILIEGGNPLWIFSISAFVCCYGVSFVLMLTQYSPADMVRAFRALSMKRATSRSELLVVKAFFETLQAILIATGLMSLLLGFVFVLAGWGTGRFSPVNTAAGAEGLAVSLMGLLYAMIGVVFLTAPFVGAAKKKLALLEND